MSALLSELNNDLYCGHPRLLSNIKEAEECRYFFNQPVICVFKRIKMCSNLDVFLRNQKIREYIFFWKPRRAATAFLGLPTTQDVTLEDNDWSDKGYNNNSVTLMTSCLMFFFYFIHFYNMLCTHDVAKEYLWDNARLIVRNGQMFEGA